MWAKIGGLTESNVVYKSLSNESYINTERGTASFSKVTLQHCKLLNCIHHNPLLSNSTKTMSRSWVLTGQEGFEVSLKYDQNAKVPSAGDLGPNEVLVKMYSASLNYRELVIARGVSSCDLVYRVIAN